MLKFVDDAKRKFGVWNRERKERAEDKKAAKARSIPAGASPLLWCIFITLVGVFALGGSTWMLAVFIAGSVGHLDWVSDYVTTQEGVQRWEYTFEASVHWFNAIGLWLLCAAIGIFNAVWIEIRKHFFGVFQKWITGLGIATAVFMVSGGVVVQQRGTDARTRDEAAAVGTAQAGVAAIDAEIGALTQRWETLCAANLTTYQAQACRSGETAWRERIETARAQRDYQLPGIERALADAREGDRMQARLLELRTSRAQASVQTVEAETTSVRAEGWMAPIVAFIEDLRKPVTSVLGELLAMSAFPMALAAWATRRRRRDVESSGWAPEELRIEDLRDEEAIVPQPMKPAREVVTDADTGEELVRVRESKPRDYWRKVKKGKRTKVDVTPQPEPDEAGFQDARTATSGVTLGGVMELVEPHAKDGENKQPNDDYPSASDNVVEEIGVATAEPKATVNYAEEQGHDERGADTISDQPEPPVDFEELAAQLTEPELPVLPTDTDVSDQGAGDGSSAEDDQQQINHHEPSQREEPETNPAKLIAAE